MATDADVIDYLRAAQQQSREPDVMKNAQLAASLHPSELPRCFVVAGPGLQWNTTPHGLWKQKKGRGYTAVRRGSGAGTDSGRASPTYIGVKRTLEFCKPNGAKTGWAVVQYNKLDQAGTDLVIDEKMVFCKVFEQKDDGQIHYEAPLHLATNLEPLPEYTGSFFQDVDSMFSDFNPEHHPIYGDLRLSPLPGDQLDAAGWQSDYLNNDEVLVAPPEPEEGGERSRSEVWEHFTKIHGKDPQDVYAACFSCDGLLKAHSKKHGTSPLWNHYKMHLRGCVQPCSDQALLSGGACALVSLYPQ